MINFRTEFNFSKYRGNNKYFRTRRVIYEKEGEFNIFDYPAASYFREGIINFLKIKCLKFDL